MGKNAAAASATQTRGRPSVLATAAATRKVAGTVQTSAAIAPPPTAVPRRKMRVPLGSGGLGGDSVDTVTWARHCSNRFLKAIRREVRRQVEKGAGQCECPAIAGDQPSEARRLRRPKAAERDRREPGAVEPNVWLLSSLLNPRSAVADCQREPLDARVENKRTGSGPSARCQGARRIEEAKHGASAQVTEQLLTGRTKMRPLRVNQRAIERIVLGYVGSDFSDLVALPCNGGPE